MIYILIAIYFLQFCCQALSTLPAPVNVNVESLNFEHNLRWDPGPGTPPGTTYRLQYGNKGMSVHVPNSSVPVVKQTLQQCALKVEELCTIKVQAIHNGNTSDWTIKEFTPYTDTFLGPPEVTVSGCGDCLNLTITLPRGKASQSISEIYHVFNYQISWKTDGESKVWNTSTTESRLVLPKLEQGRKYCVRVSFQLNTNKHILPSGWVCAFTSAKKESLAISILACASALLILSGLVLLGLMYVGVLCRLKTPLPRALSLMEAHSNYCFTVEEITPDAVICDAGGGEKGAGVPAQKPVRDGLDEEEDEEEEDPSCDEGYENRMAACFHTGSSSGTASHNTTGSMSTAATALSTAESSGDTGVVGEEPQRAEMPGGDGTLDLSMGAKEQQKTQCETVDWDTDPGEDVNLLTVKLGAPDGQSVAEQMGGLWCWQPPLQLTGSGDSPARLDRVLADRQADSQGLLHAALLLTFPDCEQTDADCLQTHTNWEEEEEKEQEEEYDEEDEECSGYMRR